MSDTPDEIRQQMEETKSQLSDKLVSLESQVSETVQSTGTAVNATVGAVQETVETVTGAVQDAVQSVSNAFDLKRQFQRNPWLVIGGAAVLGYFAVEFLRGSRRKPARLLATTCAPAPIAVNPGDADAQSAAIAAAYEAGRESSHRHELQSAAVGALIAVVQDVASRAVPPLMDYLTASLAGHQPRPAETTGENCDPVARPESPDAAQRLRFASAERGRDGNSYKIP